MSRVGLNPVSIPSGVTVDVVGRQMTAKGKLGEQSLTFVDEVEPSLAGDQLRVKPTNDSIKARKLWGTYRSLAQNVVTGVSEGFTRVLDINGVGYRAAIQGKSLNLQLGHSHDINFPIPDTQSEEAESKSPPCESPASPMGMNPDECFLDETGDL